jgi:DNA-binding NarL/FixJ family response regulator
MKRFTLVLSAAAKFGVLVVDVHPIMRLGIAAIINAQPDMKVCSQAESGTEAVRMFRKHRPDVTLMDLRLPGMSGLDALRAIRHDDPGARCLVLTTYEGDEDIHQALEAGAAGYLIKAISQETLVDALRKVHARCWLNTGTSAPVAWRQCQRIAIRATLTAGVIKTEIANKDWRVHKLQSPASFSKSYSCP